MNHIIVICFVLLYYAITFFLLRGIKISTRNLCLCGIVVAMTLVLESILIPLPTGAFISPGSPIPLMLLAILVDYRLAIVGGWICGVMAMFMVPGWQLVHWGQFFVEHMVCFSCLGYTGALGTDKRHQIVGGMVLASCLKIMGHLLSGVVFFSENAWDGWGAWGYSMAYNFSQNVPLCLVSGMVVLMLPLKAMKLAVGEK